MLFKVELPPKALIHVLEKLSDIEYRLSNGTNEKLQMSSLISTFIMVRNMCDSTPKSIPV